jgi:hypothetical protein
VLRIQHELGGNKADGGERFFTIDTNAVSGVIENGLADAVVRALGKLPLCFLQTASRSLLRLCTGGNIGWKQLQAGRRLGWLRIFRAKVERDFPLAVALLGPDGDIVAKGELNGFVALFQFPYPSGISQISGACGEGEDRLPNERAWKIGTLCPIFFPVDRSGRESDSVFREIFDACRRHSFCDRKVGIFGINLRDLPGS